VRNPQTNRGPTHHGAHRATPTRARVSSTVPSEPARAARQTGSLMRASSGRTCQFGLGSALSHRKSSTLAHWLGASPGAVCVGRGGRSEGRGVVGLVVHGGMDDSRKSRAGGRSAWPCSAR
jgi:hypothetical protein